MPKLSLEEVEHIAELARLSLSSAEKEMFRDQLSSILAYADMLNRLDTRGVPPTASALPLPAHLAQAQVSHVLRRDQVRPSLPTQDAMSNAPDAETGQFRVRAVLEQD